MPIGILMNCNLQRPNFFIIGAPKCGTTSLSEYLRAHPNVLMSSPKEPYFFSTDFNLGFISSLEEYLTTCFHGLSDHHRAVGEASAWYLYSEDAVPQILDFNPDARFIIMVRNPIDMFASLHSQMFMERNENIEDAEAAWDFQWLRQKGYHIPKLCRVPRFLQYKAACSLGSQVKIFFSMVERNRVKVFVFDDFIRDTEAVYGEVLSFLDLPNDGKQFFGAYNENKVIRSKLIANLVAMAQGNKKLLYLLNTAKKIANIEKFGLSERNVRKKKRSPLSPSFRTRLSKCFQDDVHLLSGLIGRDLTYWLIP